MDINYKLLSENFLKFLKHDEFGADFPNLNIEKVKDFIEKHGIKVTRDYHDGAFAGVMKDGTNVILELTEEDIMIRPTDKNDSRRTKLDIRHLSKE